MKVNGTNISMIRGDSESITISCTDINNLPVAFVFGDTVYFTVKEKTTNVEKTLQKTVITFDNGKAVIEITPSDTRDLRCKRYVYDVQLTRADLTVTTLVAPSDFIIEEEVTFE